MQKTKDPINEYFSNKGIDVSYNTLNGTEELVKSYIKQFGNRVNQVKGQKSQYIKSECYSTLYNMEPRVKLTGFEKYKKFDQEFRLNISSLVTKPQFSSTLVVDPKYNDVTVSYKDLLKDYVKTFKNPLLYLSGGLDSELVANAMIDAGINFTPVIFNYIDNHGNVINKEDVDYAYKFCTRNGLFPIFKQLNIKELWSSKDFANLALELEIVSPHLLTHVYMIKMMEHEFTGRTHMFGGEVRFRNNFALDDGRPANLVLLDKLIPAYNTNEYTSASFITTEFGSIANNYLYYNWTTGLGVQQNWTINQVGNDTVTGSPRGHGTVPDPIQYWATSSAISQSTYEFSVSPTIYGNSGATGFSAGTSWSTIGGSGAEICYVTCDSSSGAAYISVTFDISLRSVANPGTVQSSSVKFTSTSYGVSPS